MGWRRRATACAAAVLVAAFALLAQPSPPAAQANPVCHVADGLADVVSGGIEAVTGGAVGVGNPLGDACEKVSGGVTDAATAPLNAAVEGIGNGVFNQLTSWVSEGAAWLIGRVVKSIDKTTTPQLASKGFLAQYMKMAAIASAMAIAMLLLAVLEGIAQGNWMLLARAALVNAPLAMIATTVAYAIVQLLLVVTDGLCAVISASSDHGTQRFFETAITGLGKAGGSVGKEVGGGLAGPGGGVAAQGAGAAEVPLFVGFLAAIVGAFAAFFVWLELLMRDAAVYVVSLFLPLSLAASVWPRWMVALRRTAELLLAVIGSKFVIVAIVGLAAALVAGGEHGIEHVLAASALMLLACFAPFVLLKLIPFAEGALGAAYGRRSASGGAISGVQLASDVAILRGMVAARRGDSGVTLWGGEGGSAGGGPSGGRGGKPSGSGGGPAGGKSGGPSSAGGGGAKSGGSGGGAGAAAGAAGAVASVPAAVGRGAKGSAGRLSQSAAASQAKGYGRGAAGGETSKAGASEAGSSPSAGERPPRPRSDPPSAKPGAKGST
jgi:hypothetical protein